MTNKTYHIKNQIKLQKFIEQLKKKNDPKPNNSKNTRDSRSTRTN